MNLVSCDHCGVVLDGVKLDFPKEVYLEDNISVNNEKGSWSNDLCSVVPYVHCPVCGNEILKEF